MKALLPFTLLVLGACGKVDVGSVRNNNLGELLSAQPVVVDGIDRQRLDQICQAMRVKEGVLASGQRPTQTFQVSKKSCESSDLGGTTSVTVGIVEEIGKYKFQPTAGQAFPFQDVETTSFGVMAAYCADPANFVNPYVDQNGEGIFLSTQSVGDCAAGVDELCLMVKRGSLSQGSYRIHTNDWFKFRVTATSGVNAVVGFFTDRKQTSDTVCVPPRFSQTRSQLLIQ